MNSVSCCAPVEVLLVWIAAAVVWWVARHRRYFKKTCCNTSADMDPAEEPDPYHQEQRQKQQEQTSSVHVFRSSHGVRPPTSATITGGGLWCGEESRSHWTPESRRWWHRRRRFIVSCTGTNCNAAACGAEAGAKSVRRTQITLPPSAQQRWRRARARPFYDAWGVLLFLLLSICWWSPSDRPTGRGVGGSAILVLGASVSVGFGGGCPNACSRHGYCTGPSTETCECHQGWAGGDCSIRE